MCGQWVGTRLFFRKTVSKKKIIRNANGNECLRGHFLFRGQDMDKTQNHRNSIEQLVGGWRLVAVGGSMGDWRLVVLPGLSLRAVLNKKRRGS